MSSDRVSQASLILDDGTVYKGKLFGASECVAGEVGKFLKLFLGFIVRSLTHFRHMHGFYSARTWSFFFHMPIRYR